jgi:hypothetical protein
MSSDDDVPLVARRKEPAAVASQPAAAPAPSKPAAAAADSDSDDDQPLVKRAPGALPAGRADGRPTAHAPDRC